MTPGTISSEQYGVRESLSADKSGLFKPTAPQNVAPPKPVIVPWQKKK